MTTELAFGDNSPPPVIDETPAVTVVCTRCGQKFHGTDQADAEETLKIHVGGHMLLVRDIEPKIKQIRDDIATIARAMTTTDPNESKVLGGMLTAISQNAEPIL